MARPGSVTVAATEQVRFYKRRADRHPGHERAESTYACLLATGHSVRLDDPRDDDSYAYPKPALAANGSEIAYAVDVVGPYNQSNVDGTKIVVFDLASATTPDKAVRFDASEGDSARVGSVVASQSGSVAWIVCPFKGGTSEGSPRPNCTTAGRSYNRVLTRSAGSTESQVVDGGSDIYPRSLKLDGSNITWRAGPERRSAPIG